jgi:hypothetical protein
MALLVKLLQTLQVLGVLLQVKLVDHYFIEEKLELQLEAITSNHILTIYIFLHLFSQAVQRSASAPGLNHSHQVYLNSATPSHTLENKGATPGMLNRPSGFLLLLPSLCLNSFSV